MKIEKDEIRIGISKKKGYLITSILMVFLAVLIWALLKVMMLPEAFNRTFLIICLSSLIITVSLVCFSGLIKLFDNKQGLIVNNIGIQINTGPNCGHFVKWNEIIELKTYNQTKGTMTLLIFVKNPKDFIEKFSGLKRFLLIMNNVSHKTPISLTSNWLDCSFEELVLLIEDNYKKST